MKLKLGYDDLMAQWVAQRIPHMNGGGFGPCVAVGVADDRNQPIGGVVFHDYQPQYGNAMVSMAATTPKWLTKSLISGILAIPFQQYGLKRLTAITPPGETSVSRFLQKFGWVREGVIRHGLGDQDAWLWGLLAKEWRFHRYNLLRPVTHGKVSTLPAAASRSNGGRQRPERRQHSNGAGAAAPQHGREPRTVGKRPLVQ